MMQNFLQNHYDQRLSNGFHCLPSVLFNSEAGVNKLRLSKQTAWAQATIKMRDFKGGNSKYSPITDRLLPLR
jgi:hypothetical protein